MTVFLYKNNSQPNVIDKDIDKIDELNCDLLGVCSELSPVLEIGYNPDFIDCNYCYIDVFKRYYYVVVTVDDAKRMILNCSVDPLMSWKTGILNSEAVVIRNSGIGHPTDIKDDSLPIHPDKFNLSELFFPIQPFNNDSWSYIIGVRN